jgi:hypothetical protein
MSIDVWSLFLVLLVTSMLQEFAIKPLVGFIKKHYHDHLLKTVLRFFVQNDNV